jgi:hypothetical protein
MRSMIFAALVAATTISVASAENDKDVTDPDKTPGISPQQQAKIPYIPCTEAVGWVNGRLRCNNRS